jgi:NitT/TauT family transport system substrate-binding protein
MRPFKTLAAAMLLGALAIGAAKAETAEIRLARQYSMGYLQFNVMEHQNLIEKHARALGLNDVKVSWLTFNGPAAINDALLSGGIDIASGGVPGLVLLWARTKGTAAEVKGISALSSQPFLLNTREARIGSIKDVQPSDKIAVPAIKVSVQAITLQMAAAKAFGQDNFGKLDANTVSLSPPDATAALLSGSGEINLVFSVPPFQYQQLEKPGVKTILNSYDVLDGPHSFTVAWTSARFRDKNPTLYKALVAALEEATDIVNKDRRAAAALWIEDSKSKLPLDFVAGVVSGAQVRWTMTPENTMKFARFMATTGIIKAAPQSWQDYFFPEIHGLNGS